MMPKNSWPINMMSFLVRQNTLIVERRYCISCLTFKNIKFFFSSTSNISTTTKQHDNLVALTSSHRLLTKTDTVSLSILRNRAFPVALNISQRRWKNKNAKIGLHLQNLDEIAHATERQNAEERRRKKKEKKSARNDNGIVDSISETTSTLNLVDDFDGEHIENSENSEDEVHYDVNVLPNPTDVSKLMLKHVHRFDEYLKTIRGAEPSPELFDQILVDAYGDPNTPLHAVAQVVLVSHTMATATCFDPALAKSVANAIRDKLSLNPSIDDGGIVTIPIPRVSMETRQELSGMVKKRAEFFRQRIRGVRRKVLDVVKHGAAGKLEHVSKDDAFRVQKDIEAMTEEMIQKINKAADKKNSSIMSV